LKYLVETKSLFLGPIEGKSPVKQKNHVIFK